MTSLTVINTLRLFNNESELPFPVVDVQALTLQIEAQRKKPQTSESEVAQILAEAAVQCMNAMLLTEARDFYAQIGKKSLNTDLQCSYQLAEARAQLLIATKSKTSYAQFQQTIQSIKLEKLSFDLESQTKLYGALAQILNNQQVHQASQTLIGSISTFSSDELLDFSGFASIALLLAASNLSRKLLKALIDSQTDALASANPPVLSLIKCIIGCNYGSFYSVLGQVKEFIRSNFWLRCIENELIEQITSGVYQQYLQAFLVTGVQEMAQEFAQEFEQFKNQLEYFIFRGMIQARMDAVTWQIRKIEQKECDKWWGKFLEESLSVIAKVEVLQKGKQ
ncbi:26S proteasome non-ATPase regulatory subunit 6 [Spironucleus salmonicida]|uniref:26S proteasome non-ATPase regulatory subunit 6 n=1 Tax=Spironucleus salmonicida TaxID=348837 RepID=V6LVJ5_9EUKA|nr:26S proteasome non-ATPase regulatory subunit 6 [Spironucleus salmonicida]|eukprot:EST44834.1 26S proteasome non-ATPase regulatory subunit 6 [Spironucleus salmonicida]